MSNAAEIADLITKGISAPTGAEDTALHTGTIVTWDPLSNVNSVNINGVLLPNLKALQQGIGLSYTVGDVVLIQRKQTQYYIVGKIAAANGVAGTTGSAPDYRVGGGSAISGSTGVWRDLDGGAGVSPSVTARIGNNCMVMFGVGALSANNAIVDIGVELSGASVWPAGTFLGQSLSSGQDNQANGGPTNMSAPSKTLMFYKNTSVANFKFKPGITTFSLKYRLGLFNNGTGANVAAPWIAVIPF